MRGTKFIHDIRCGSTNQLEYFHLQKARFELQLQADLGACACHISRDAWLRTERKWRLGKWSSEIHPEPRRKIGAERQHTPDVLCENRQRKEDSLRSIFLGNGCPMCLILRLHIPSASWLFSHPSLGRAQLWASPLLERAWTHQLLSWCVQGPAVCGCPQGTSEKQGSFCSRALAGILKRPMWAAASKTKTQLGLLGVGWWGGNDISEDAGQP